MSENIYETLLEKLDGGIKAVTITTMENGECKNEPSKNKVLLTEENIINNNYECNFDEMVYEKAKYSMETGTPQFVKISEEEAYLIEPYFPEPKLVVLGGGHIAKPLTEFAARAGFRITVIDDRPYFANRERFPDAEKVICESFEKCFDLINLDKATFVVIVTRGHRHDMNCLRQVLKHDTAYVGMIGSKRRVKGTIEQLLSEGYSQETLEKLNAPIGLPIGAVTPDEVAFSIMAQLIQFRRQREIKQVGNKLTKVNWPEFDREVLEGLSKEENSNKAIATIISTKGSVPRKAGAKMLILSNGNIVGTIGGGCSEGEIINTARYLLRNGGYKNQRIDMTAEVAEEEGMVCGGTMDVVIECFWK